ncbi:Nif3-like dinuclear metal center hexameric protein [Peptococcaceae bacterium 1198_IL3148]
MSVKNRDLFRLIEELAPKQLAEDWDNVGLQVGNDIGEVKRVLVTLDVDEAVVKEAIEKEIDLIIAHHPLLMKGIKSINIDSPKGLVLSQLIKNNITVYAAHTNLDIADGGVNSVLADKLGLQNVEVLAVTGSQRYIKLVVFVPMEHQEQVRTALTNAGAGWIGNYSDCTFRTTGTGTFLPREGANPFIGVEGKVEQVAEVRIETIVPVEKLAAVVKAMEQAHPYEEVAYDVYPLNNQGPVFGLGRIGTLTEAVPFTEFVLQLKEALNLKTVKVGGDQQRLIKKVALCGGSAADFWPKALAKGADVYVSGDVKYHTAQDMVAAGLCFVDGGHYGTEIPVVQVLCNYLKTRCVEENFNVEIMTTKSYQEPFVYL